MSRDYNVGIREVEELTIMLDGGITVKHNNCLVNTDNDGNLCVALKEEIDGVTYYNRNILYLESKIVYIDMYKDRISNLNLQVNKDGIIYVAK